MAIYPLMTVADLSEQLARHESAPVVLDVRWAGPGATGGREAFQQEHIPGARFIDAMNVLSGPGVEGSGGRHPLPAPERFESGMRAAGVTSDCSVVVYDDWKSIAASRAWWLLRYFGHADVRVLDGGLGAWRAAGHTVEQGVNEGVDVGEFAAKPPQLASLDAAGAAEAAASGVLLDGRPAGRFRGENETVDAVAGHIPGAQSLPALDLVREDGTFLAPAELRERFSAVGVESHVPAATYCGSGFQACHVALAAAAAGITDDMAVYAGSWSDWITDRRRPIDVA